MKGYVLEDNKGFWTCTKCFCDIRKTQKAVQVLGMVYHEKCAPKGTTFAGYKKGHR